MQSVAILGGGISGLSAAYYLACQSPKTRITLFESSSRLGGWIRTETTNGINFELGPRTLRPEQNTVDLLTRLNLQGQVVKISKSHPAAQNRYILYKNQLNRLPQSVPSLIRNCRMPVLAGIFSLLLEPFRPRSTLEDESIHDFISRRFDPQIARNVISAVVGGIHAGDATKLSIRSALPSLWNYEKKYGSVLIGIVKEPRAKVRGSEDVCIYSFKNGMQTLPDGLAEYLKDVPNVEFKIDTTVKTVTMSSSGINVDGQDFSHVISALPCLSQNKLIPCFPKLATVSVHLVNMYYPNENLIPVDGFGYLVPSSEPNPECLLGVMFDSMIFPGGTKLGVMMGGHHYDQIPSEQEVTKRSLSIIKNHLKFECKPETMRVSFLHDCIPQYHVGYWQKMKSTHEKLLEQYHGKLSIVGNSVAGVGINDCITRSKRVISRLLQGDLVTGLEECF